MIDHYCIHLLSHRNPTPLRLMPFALHDQLTFFVNVIYHWTTLRCSSHAVAPDSQSSLCSDSCHHCRWLQYPQCSFSTLVLHFLTPLISTAFSTPPQPPLPMVTLDVLINKITDIPNQWLRCWATTALSLTFLACFCNCSHLGNPLTSLDSPIKDQSPYLYLSL